MAVSTEGSQYHTCLQTNSIVESKDDLYRRTPKKFQQIIFCFSCLNWSWWVSEKSLGSCDPGRELICIFSKWLSLKISISTNFLWLVLDQINVLATDTNMGFLNQVDIISSPYIDSITRHEFQAAPGFQSWGSRSSGCRFTARAYPPFHKSRKAWICANLMGRLAEGWKRRVLTPVFLPCPLPPVFEASIFKAKSRPMSRYFCPRAVRWLWRRTRGPPPVSGRVAVKRLLLRALVTVCRPVKHLGIKTNHLSQLSLSSLRGKYIESVCLSGWG